ncbi:AAA family ATPase [Actinospongicola halichondriae]|uniref:AAA family ATPase n=1 Tax=Actinospongicola halichondriae TaxID=3236844 RepID=UPI003D54A9BB
MSDTPGVAHRRIDSSMVFVDISGFTALSERLAAFGRVGAEAITDLLQEVFARLLAVAYDNDGSLLKFGGDALLLLFVGPGHEARAANSADGMRRELLGLGELESMAGKVRLGMTVGAHCGAFDFFLVGDSHQELLVAGPEASRVVELEGTAESGEVMISRELAAHLDPDLVVPGRSGGCLLTGTPAAAGVSASSFGDKDRSRASRALPTAVRRFLEAGGEGAEHRQAVVAFLAFDGTDDLLERNGADACAAALDDLVTRTATVCDEHDIAFLGSDVAPNGGKLILVAGAPVGHDDDGERILRVARAVTAEPSALAVRVGVNPGPLFAGVVGPPYRLTYTVMGDTVNLAARLAYQAGDGEVLATLELLERTRSRFDSSPVVPFLVKGKSQPIEAAVVGQPRGQQFTDGLRLPLAGRQRELSLLEELLEATRERGRVVEVTGPPGIGKSRLLEELRERHPQRRLRYGGCTTYESGTPYFPFRGLLRFVLDLDPDADADVVLARLRDRAPESVPWASLIGTVVDIDIEPSPAERDLDPRYRGRRLRTAVGDLLVDLLPDEAILRIEDVHWIDDASRGLVEHLASVVVPSTGWMMVLTSRSTTFGSVADEVIDLAPLGDDAVESLAHQAAARGLVTLDVARDLADRSQGNPLFLEELLAYAHTGDEVPDSVERLIAARIDRLDPRHRDLLRRAALLGSSFDLELLRSITGEEITDADVDVLEAFVARDPSGQYVFEHDLYREVAYTGLPYRRRRELHEVAGRVIETRHAGRTEEVAELLALHYHRAGMHRRSWEHNRVAAARAKGSHALADAARFLRWGLEDARHDQTIAPTDRAIAWAELGDVLEVLGNYPAAADAYERARRLTPDADAPSLWHRTGIVRERAGRLTQALRWYGRAERALTGRPDPDDQLLAVRVRLRKAEVRLLQGRSRSVVELIRELVEQADHLGAPELRARANFALAWALGNDPEAAGPRARALELYAQTGDLIGQANVHLDAGVWLHYASRDWSDVVRHYASARELKAAAGDEVGAAIASANLGEVLSDQGRFDAGREALERGLVVFEASSFLVGVANTACYLARLHARAGAFDESHRVFALATDAANEAQLGGVRLEILARQAELALFERRLDDAVELAGQVLGESDGSPKTVGAARTRGSALGLSGDTTSAEHELRAARTQADRSGVGYEVALIDAARAWFLEAADPSMASTLRAGVDEVRERLALEVDPLVLALGSVSSASPEP